MDKRLDGYVPTETSLIKKRFKRNRRKKNRFFSAPVGRWQVGPAQRREHSQRHIGRCVSPMRGVHSLGLGGVGGGAGRGPGVARAGGGVEEGSPGKFEGAVGCAGLFCRGGNDVNDGI